jgi:predicted acylesterase/phospholipase RssA
LEVVQLSNQATLKRAKAILSLDGGGVRGTITVAFLKRLEKLLRERDNNPSARLCDYFDLIGGTSTGAIIATALSLGLTTTEIESFYFKLAPLVFRKSWFRLIGVQAVFDEKRLKKEVLEVCGDRRLDSDELKTSLAIVMKRMDTGSPWIVTSNPNAPYWNDPDDEAYIGNCNYRLAELVRASTAAPHYFAPESISVADGEPPGLFVDGGVTPHNNPALALFHQATIPALGYGWSASQDDMMIVSIGTGSFRPRLDPDKARRMTAAGLALKALAGMIADAGTHVLMQMQLMGRTDTHWTINSEIGDLSDTHIMRNPLFTFQRYDALLENEWLSSQLGFELQDREIRTVRMMENPDGIPLAFEIGCAAAEKFLKEEHLKLLQKRR